mmetsp:Transcript_28103/g.36756  ORF Transcript_28103/g.36756 Transcript_28103/m.36756 type:complete len:108 (-) Transcript_28103:307-630(-)
MATKLPELIETNQQQQLLQRRASSPPLASIVNRLPPSSLPPLGTTTKNELDGIELPFHLDVLFLPFAKKNDGNPIRRFFTNRNRSYSRGSDTDDNDGGGNHEEDERK